MDAALSRVLPRWQAAFRKERYYHETWQGTRVPFTIEQCTAIVSGATTVDLGPQMQATIEGDQVHIDGNAFDLKKGFVAPEELVVASGRDSSHMDLGVILAELEIVTGIVERRWLIHVDAWGNADVHIAPSVAYVAPEIRDRSVTDLASLAQWLITYDVKASREQLTEVFGSTAAMLGPGAGGGKDSSIIGAFFAPLRVVLHRKSGRDHTINARGTFTVRKVLTLAPAGHWHLHGVPLQPFDDVAIWRCCTHDNTVLHLYDHPHDCAYESRETIAGTLQLPQGGVGPRAFVPYPTVSGNMFGDAPLKRVEDVVAAAPAQLDSLWLTWVNANDAMISFDHARLMLDALQSRYGRAACLEAICKQMYPGQASVFKQALASGRMPRSYVRRRYICYVKCIKDLLDGTAEAPTIRITLADRAFDVPRAMKWSKLALLIPAGYRAVPKGPLSSAARTALCRPDFLLEEMRTDNFEITLEKDAKKRKRE